MTEIERERDRLRRDLNSSLPWRVGEIKGRLEDRKRDIENKEVTFVDGIARWVESKNIVPLECTVQFEYIGAPVNVEKTRVEERKENEQFFAEYAKMHANDEISPETLFEMRAAFGEGAVVVDAITGREIRL